MTLTQTRSTTLSSQIGLQGVSLLKECAVPSCVVVWWVVLWWLGRLQPSQTGRSHIWVTHPSENEDGRLAILAFISAAAPGQKAGGAVGAETADKCLPQLNHELIDFTSGIARAERGAAHPPALCSIWSGRWAPRREARPRRLQFLIEIKIFFSLSTFQGS